MNGRVTAPSSSAHLPTAPRRRRLGLALASLGVATSSLTLAGLATTPAQAAPPDSPAHACRVDGGISIACTSTYTFTGAEQTFQVPDAGKPTG